MLPRRLVAFQANEPNNDANNFFHCPYKQNDYNISGEEIKRRRCNQTSNYRDQRVLPGFPHKRLRRKVKKASRPISGGLSRLVPIGQTLRKSLMRCLFEQPLFRFFLAFDAMAGPRHCFQPLGIDLFAAGDTFAKASLANAGKSALDHLQKLTIVIALMKEEFFGVRAGGAVSDVL